MSSIKTVQNLLDEVRTRTDASNIEDKELLFYIDELDDIMGDSIFPQRESIVIPLIKDVHSYDVSNITETERIKKVFVDGKRIVQKSSADDLLEGWYTEGVKLFLSPVLAAENSEMVLIYHPRKVPHTTADTNLSVPETFHDLYVYHCLAQIAAKEGDEVSYNNYQNDYNGLLSEVLSIVTGKQLSPSFTKWG